MRDLYKSSLQDLLARPLCETFIQELSTRSLHRTPICDISLQDLLISLNFLGLLTGALYNLHKPHIKHLYTRSPGIPRPAGSLHRSSLQDLFTRPLWEISSEELSTRSLHKTSMRDLYTRALYKISSQDLYERSLYKSSLSLCKISSQDPHMRYLYTRSPDIPGPPRSLHRSSLQDLFTRPLWEISIQDLLISLDLWDLLTTRSLPKTSIRTQHAESTERVARTKSKSARRYSESDPTRTNSAEGCTSRNKKCPRLSASDIPSAKWARRYSQSHPTRTKSREGCICKHKIGTAPQRDSKNQSSDRTLASELQYEMQFFDVLRRKYCACHEKMSPRHTKSCNCHAKWCQHSRSKFDDSFTKRAFRALQDRLQEHQILRLPRKMTIFHHLQFRATLTTILHTSQNPHVFYTFPDFRKSTRRAGENAPPKWTSQRPRLAQAKCIFSISTTTFHREGRQKSRTRQRTPPIYTRCFSITVRTP